MPPINYVTKYAQALSQAYPYVLHFGALYATPNNGRFRWTGARTIEIPSITTTGRVDSNRDTVALAQRNYDNSWEPKTLANQRKWSTLVHPMDIDQTNDVATINNITAVFNNEQKFPEMDAYCISKIYADWIAQSRVADTTAPTVDNILSLFDAMMQGMTEDRVPAAGRILYCTPAVDTMLKNATAIQRSFDVQTGAAVINRNVVSLDQVQKEVVPPELMKTIYDFTTGWRVGDTADPHDAHRSHGCHHSRQLSVCSPRSSFCWLRGQVRLLRRVLRGCFHPQQEGRGYPLPRRGLICS